MEFKKYTEYQKECGIYKLLGKSVNVSLECQQREEEILERSMKSGGVVYLFSHGMFYVPITDTEKECIFVSMGALDRLEMSDGGWFMSKKLKLILKDDCKIILSSNSIDEFYQLFLKVLTKSKLKRGKNRFHQLVESQKFRIKNIASKKYLAMENNELTFVEKDNCTNFFYRNGLIFVDADNYLSIEDGKVVLNGSQAKWRFSRGYLGCEEHILQSSPSGVIISQFESEHLDQQWNIEVLTNQENDKEDLNISSEHHGDLDKFQLVAQMDKITNEKYRLQEEFDKKLRSKHLKIKSLTHFQDTLKENILELENKLKRESEENESLRGKIRTLESNNPSTVTGEARKHTQEQVQMESNLVQQMESNLVQQMESNFQQMEAEVADLKQENENLEIKLQESKIEIQRLKNELMELSQSPKKGIRHRFQEHHLKFQRFKEDLEKQKELMGQIRSQNESLEKENEILRKDMFELETKYSKLHDVNETLTVSLEKSKESLRSERHKHLLKEQQHFSDKNSDLSKRETELARRERELDQKYEEVDREKGELSNKHASLLKESDILEKQMAELAAENKKIKEEMEALEQSKKSMFREMEIEKDLLKKERDELLKKESSIRYREDEINSLVQDLSLEKSLLDEKKRIFESESLQNVSSDDEKEMRQQYILGKKELQARMESFRKQQLDFEQKQHDFQEMMKLKVSEIELRKEETESALNQVREEKEKLDNEKSDFKIEKQKFFIEVREFRLKTSDKENEIEEKERKLTLEINAHSEKVSNFERKMEELKFFDQSLQQKKSEIEILEENLKEREETLNSTLFVQSNLELKERFQKLQEKERNISAAEKALRGEREQLLLLKKEVNSQSIESHSLQEMLENQRNTQEKREKELKQLEENLIKKELELSQCDEEERRSQRLLVEVKEIFSIDGNDKLISFLKQFKKTATEIEKGSHESKRKFEFRKSQYEDRIKVLENETVLLHQEIDTFKHTMQGKDVHIRNLEEQLNENKRLLIQGQKDSLKQDNLVSNDTNVNITEKSLCDIGIQTVSENNTEVLPSNRETAIINDSETKHISQSEIGIQACEIKDEFGSQVEDLEQRLKDLMIENEQLKRRVDVTDSLEEEKEKWMKEKDEIERQYKVVMTHKLDYSQKLSDVQSRFHQLKDGEKSFQEEKESFERQRQKLKENWQEFDEESEKLVAARTEYENKIQKNRLLLIELENLQKKIDKEKAELEKMKGRDPKLVEMDQKRSSISHAKELSEYLTTNELPNEVPPLEFSFQKNVTSSEEHENKMIIQDPNDINENILSFIEDAIKSGKDIPTSFLQNDTNPKQLETNNGQSSNFMDGGLDHNLDGHHFFQHPSPQQRILGSPQSSKARNSPQEYLYESNSPTYHHHQNSPSYHHERVDQNSLWGSKEHTIISPVQRANSSIRIPVSQVYETPLRKVNSQPSFDQRRVEHTPRMDNFVSPIQGTLKPTLNRNSLDRIKRDRYFQQSPPPHQQSTQPESAFFSPIQSSKPHHPFADSPVRKNPRSFGIEYASPNRYLAETTSTSPNRYAETTPHVPVVSMKSVKEIPSFEKPSPNKQQNEVEPMYHIIKPTQSRKELKVEDFLCLTLNASTNYTWRVSIDDPSVLTILQIDQLEHKPNQPMYRYMFHAKRPARTILRMVYQNNTTKKQLSSHQMAIIVT